MQLFPQIDSFGPLLHLVLYCVRMYVVCIAPTQCGWDMARSLLQFFLFFGHRRRPTYIHVWCTNRTVTCLPLISKRRIALRILDNTAWKAKRKTSLISRTKKYVSAAVSPNRDTEFLVAASSDRNDHLFITRSEVQMFHSALQATPAAQLKGRETQSRQTDKSGPAIIFVSTATPRMGKKFC